MKKTDIQFISLAEIIEAINETECPTHHIKARAFEENNRIISYGCCRSFTDHLNYVSNSKIEALILERLSQVVENDKVES